MKILVASSLILALALSACAGSKMDPSPENGGPFISEKIFYSTKALLPLVIKTRPGSRIYQNPMVGIQIIDILADGEPVVARPSLTLFPYINVWPRTVRSDHYIYEVSPEFLIFIGVSPDGDLIQYSIPDDVRSLEIKYRFGYYEGVLDQRVHILKAFRGGGTRPPDCGL